ncbi:MAG: pyridoxamine 5'-phosphate oxidase family protein [Thermoflexales bacterium]
MTKDLGVVREFIRRYRQATLAVCERGEPLTAMVAYVPTADCSAVFIQLSNLSPHKRMLLANPRCSVLIAAPDDGRAEVLSLPRVTLQGHAFKLDKGDPEYAQSRSYVLERMPSSAVLFSLPDFDLFRITFTEGRFIGGFGQAFAFSVEMLTARS